MVPARAVSHEQEHQQNLRAGADADALIGKADVKDASQRAIENSASPLRRRSAAPRGDVRLQMRCNEVLLGRASPNRIFVVSVCRWS